MGALSGSISYTRFQVVGDLPPNVTGVLESAIMLRRFVPLHPEGDDVRTHGWVSAQRPYADEEPIHNHHFLFGERIILGFREDVIRLPKQMIRDKLAQKIAEHKQKNGIEPGAQLRYHMQLAIMTELRRKVLPHSKVTDMMWDLSRREVRLFARGKGVIERFEEFFTQTFELALRQKTPAQLAVSADLSVRAKSMLEHLQPTEIFRPVSRTEVN